MTTLEQAFAHHQAGRLREAEALYREILGQQPGHAEALHRLGVLTAQLGNYQAAVDLFQRAIAANATDPEYYNDLGIALHALGQVDAAATAYRQAIALAPSFEAYSNLGNALQERNRFAQAITAYRQALALNPDAAGTHMRLGDALMGEGQLDAALAAYRQALALAPSPEAYNALGGALHNQGRFVQAIVAFKHALALRPDSAEVYYNLGNALRGEGRESDAITAYWEALRCKPDYVDPYNNLGALLQNKGELSAAIETYRQALALKPSFAEAQFNLGIALQARGEVDEAITTYRRALDLRPDHVVAHSYLLHCMHYSPTCNADAIFAEAHKWNAYHALPLQAHIEPHQNDCLPGRRLRLGYVSPDFRTHSVSHFIAPVLAHHERNHYEVYCYYNAPQADTTTERLRGLTDHWRDIANLSDTEAAALIRSDNIDILIDLAGHTAYNRLLLFARKPAPVQVTYLGYPDTTGLATIDYRLTDALADPPGTSERFHTEALVRLPQGFLSYQPPAESLQVNAPPTLKSGYLTFGSFNDAAKLNEAVIALWAQILRASPSARLILKAAQLGDAGTAERFRAHFASHGVGPERLELLGAFAAARDHLKAYQRLDIALDPFPYSGTTTTCEALWMGVPVITLSGNTHAGRVGVSLLTQAGLPELIAESTQHYVALALALANDAPRLTALRQGLRERLAACPLCDATGFARALEAAYRQMWERYCENPDARSGIQDSNQIELLHRRT